MISDQYKFIFIHIPKTGGASIEHIIWPQVKLRTERQLWKGFIDEYHNKYQTGGLQHLKAAQVKIEVEEDLFLEYYKYGMVRNPWDKVISQFIYMQNREDLRAFIGLELKDSLKSYLEKIKRKRHVQWEPQFEFLMNEHGEWLVDDVGCYENFQTEVLTLLDKIGYQREGNFKIPHKNRTDRKHYTEYYDHESKEMVEEMYHRDIDLFNYQFEKK